MIKPKPGYEPTPEFKEAVTSGNLLRTRIMLKDSLLIDPTFVQFDEMLAWAGKKLPDLVVSHDGEMLEPASANWNWDLINQELSKLVSNFSETRILHLKKMIQKEMAEKIQRIRSMRTAGQPNRGKPRRARAPSPQDPFKVPPADAPASQSNQVGHALAALRVAGNKIGQVLGETARQGKKWTPSQVNQMKQYAQQILDAVEQYEKENK